MDGNSVHDRQGLSEPEPRGQKVLLARAGFHAAFPLKTDEGKLATNGTKKENENEDEIGSSFASSCKLNPGDSPRPVHKNREASQYVVGAAKRAPRPVHGVVARRAGAPLSRATEMRRF